MQSGGDKAFLFGADLPAPALEAGRRPFRVAAVGARHVLGIGAVLGTAIAAIMGGHAMAAMEHLDGTVREAHVDLFADQGVRHRVQEARGVDVVVEVDPCQPALGDDVRGYRQRQQGDHSTASNNALRGVPRRRMGWTLMRSTMAAIATLHSPREKNVCLRRRPRI